MKRKDLGALKVRVTGEVRFHAPLAPYTTYRIGGPAAVLVLPASEDDAAGALEFAAEAGIPWLAVGLGSNLLIADEGFDGIVIRCGKGLDAVEVSGDEGEVWTVGAGLPTPILARRSAAAGCAGVHRLIGVPGTIGGGVFMNAGAHGQEYSQVVRSVRMVDGRGARCEVRGEEVAWRYRGSGLDGYLVLGATLVLEPGDPAMLTGEVEEYLARRRAGTPFNEPCCGSVFRNPPGGADHADDADDTDVRTAGQLIEAAGLKGERLGGARVSPKHANYIVNAGGATAADVLGLIERVRSRVLEEFGVELELEVRVVGGGA